MTRRKGVPLIDVLPERYTYKDNGCEVSPTCLQCPLPQCKYDNPGWLQRQVRQQRDEEVLEVKRSRGLTVPQLAQHFGVSQRTVHRIVSRSNGNKQSH